MTKTPAMRRYRSRLWLALAAYTVLILTAGYSFRQNLVGGPVAYALALAPAVAVLAVIAAMGLYLKEETDEFQRAVVVESMLWGVGVTLAVATVWGFLEIYMAAPKLGTFWAFPIFCGSMGLAQPFVRRRFR